MEWSLPEITSLLALLVSALSLGVAFLSFLRSYRAQQPVAWLEVELTDAPNEWAGKIHLLNRSNFGWRATQAVVPLRKFPMTDKQDFLIRSSQDPAFNLKAFIRGEVLPGESGTYPIVLRRGPLSDATVVTIKFTVGSMVAKPRSKTLTVKADLPRPSVTMVLG
jgi:hypothetical protein